MKNLVVRSAFGIFIPPYDFSFYNWLGHNQPFSPTFDLSATELSPCVLRIEDPYACYAPTGYKPPFPPFSGSDLTPAQNSSFVTPTTLWAAFDPNFKSGREQTWNFSVERQFKSDILARVAYIGREAYHLPVGMEQNPGFNDKRTMYPEFANIRLYKSIDTASYNGLQLSADKHFSHDVQFTVNYTWSKALDSQSMASLSNVDSVGNPFDLGWNRGISDLNFPQIFNATWVYMEPSLKQHGKVISSIFGSWEFSGIWSMHSGRPFSINGGVNSSDNSGSLMYQDRADYSGAAIVTRAGSKSDWLNHYMNRDAFVANAVGTFGNTPRNFLTAPGWNNADLQFGRNFRYRERYRLSFRWEMFNALNRAAFGRPSRSVSASNFGQIGALMNGPRVMQGGLKLYF
jgi:hypothetical protein